MIKLHHILESDDLCSEESLSAIEIPNLVEIYITKHSTDGQNVIDIKLDDNFINKLQKTFKNFKTSKYISYSRNELYYLYDLTDDHQYVYSKMQKQTSMIHLHDYHMYLVSYKLSKLPTHLFPCVNDIDDIVEYTISECKLTNRLSIIIKKDNYGQYAFIEYKHSPQSDVEKIEAHINNIIKQVMSGYKD